jgi:hypothetical protein
MQIGVEKMPGHRRICVIGPNVFGFGETVGEAMARCKKVNGRLPRRFLVYSVGRLTKVDDMGGFVTDRNTDSTIRDIEGEYTKPLQLCNVDRDKRSFVVPFHRQ